MIPPLPPGMEIIGWIIWIFLLLFLGAGILLLLKSIFPGILQSKMEGTGISVSSESGISATLDETMRELLQEMKRLRKEIEELRKEMKE